jgi:6-phosphogluconolactonase (cycloisomerase 2 family)
MRLPRQVAFPLVCILFAGSFASATTPTITVKSPANNTDVTSAVNYVASATSSECTKGMSSMEVYSKPGFLAYGTTGGSMNTYISLQPGTYNTTVQAWDLCGGYAKVNITITVTSAKRNAGFFYLTEPDYNLVQGFVISSQGSLTAIPQGAVATNVEPWSVAADRGGHRLYVGDYKSGDVFAYFINHTNGYLYPVPGSPFPVNRSVTSIAVHPSGDFVYATRNENASGDGIAAFKVNSDGSLTETAGSPVSTGNNPWSLIVDPSGKYLYVAFLNSGQIGGYSIGSSGDLTELPGSPYTVPLGPDYCVTSATPNDIVDVVGKYAYTVDALNDQIDGFDISADGSLTNIAGAPWLDHGGCRAQNQHGNQGYNPGWIAIDGTGKFLYGVNQYFGDISIYSIGLTGSLTFIQNTSPMVQPCPFAPIVTDRAGNYLYEVGCATDKFGIFSNTVLGYKINHRTGDLMPVPGSPFLTNRDFNVIGMTTTP